MGNFIKTFEFEFSQDEMIICSQLSFSKFYYFT